MAQTLKDLKAFSQVTCYIERMSEEEKSQAFVDNLTSPNATTTTNPDAIWTNVYLNLPEKKNPLATTIMASTDGKEHFGVSLFSFFSFLLLVSLSLSLSHSSS